MKYELRKILPEHIQAEKPELVDFVEAYLEWINDEGNAAYVLNNMEEYRDIDRASDIYLEYIQRELAASIPENIASDKRKLYKNAVDIYLSKGSTPSYQALFNLAFGDSVELFFPREEILKPSDGKWDAVKSRWKNEDGQLSSNRYIQDSRYYQSFSYVIKTGQTISYWRDSVKKLLHPSGFAFFGRVSIFSEATAAMAKSQPGRVEQIEVALPIIGTTADAKAQAVFIKINFVVEAQPQVAMGTSFLHLERNKFVNGNPISLYSDYTVQHAVDQKKVKVSTPTEIIITTP